MEKDFRRGEIVVNGLVQGVGFRYFVLQSALKLGLKGYTRNLGTGEVLTVAEGEKYLIDDLFSRLKTGPRFADVKKAVILWSEFKNEFKTFEIKY